MGRTPVLIASFSLNLLSLGGYKSYICLLWDMLIPSRILSTNRKPSLLLDILVCQECWLIAEENELPKE